MKDNPYRWAAMLLLGAVLFNLIVLWPEAAVDTRPLNDSVLHLSLVERAVEALERGEDPTDPWVPYFVQGYPLFHHYQHLPHLTTALLYEGLGGVLSLNTLFNLLGYLLLSTFPLSIYWTGRRLGFGALPAASAGLVACLLSTDGLYGFDLGSYVWRGYGMYTQLWGMWLLGPALANLYVTLREGRAYAGTTALLAATLLCHTVLGYVALVSGGLFALWVEGASPRRRIGRLILLVSLVALAASYFLIPFVRDRLYMNRSVWEDPGKYDAYGWEWTLKTLVRGELLDYGRFPALTLLAALGLIVCLVRWRGSNRYRLLVIFSGFWLLLYFGRPTWGVLLNLLPLSRDLHLHRLIAPVHLGAIGLAGGGLSLIVEQTVEQQSWRAVGAGALVVGLLGPVYAERIDYLATNARWMRQSAAAFEADGGALEALLDDLRTLPAGRVYAGRSAGWGDDYRLGSVPVYALLALEQFDNPGYLYHALSLNADVEGYLDETRPGTFNLFNLRYVIAPEGQPAPAFARLLESYGRHRLYRVETSGYFDLVDSDQTWYGDRSDWFGAVRAWLQSGWVEARQHPTIVFGAAPAGEAAAWPLGDAPEALANEIPGQWEPCGQILGERVEGDIYAVEFQADRACWLLFKGSFHPGWRARLDDQPASTHMLAPSFVGLAVGPGHHRAELTYEPGDLRAWLRVVGLGGLALAALAEWRRRELEALLGHLKRGGHGALRRVSARDRLKLGRAWALVKRRASRMALWGCLHPAWVGLRPHLPYLGGLTLITLLVGLPLFQFKIMGGHDALAYLPRTVEFYQGLKEGQLFPRWAPDLSLGYGEPTFNFNAPLIYYASSFFHALGFGFVAAQNLTLLGLLWLSGLGMYLLAGEVLGRRGGLVSAAAYLLAPYLLVTLYVRYALADFSAFAFIPLAFWGLYRFVTRGQVRFVWIGAFSLALLVLSSNSVSLITFPTFVLFLGWLTYEDWRQGGSQVGAKLLRGSWCLALGLGLSAFFWWPALAERDFVHVYRRLAGYLDFHEHFVHWRQFLFSPWGYGLSLAGPKDEMSFALGLVHLPLLGVSVALLWRARVVPRARTLVSFFLVLVLLAVLASSRAALFLWEQVSFLHPLQFPWRFLSLAAVGTAFVCGFPLLLFESKESRWAERLTLVLLAGLFIASFPYAKPQDFLEVEAADYAPEVIAATGVQATARQFEPIWVKILPAEPAPPSKLLVLDGRVRILGSRLTSTHYTWQLEAASPARLRVATFYYPGWRLRVDGEARPLTVQNPYGLMDFVLGAGTHQVEVSFDLTPLRRRAVGLSLIALLLLGLTALAPRFRRDAPPAKG